MKKRCSKCKKYKNTDNFSKDISKKDNLYSSCKECKQIYSIENREKINSKQEIYNNNNKELINDKMKKYGKINRKIISEKEKIRLRIDMNFKLRKNLRTRLNKALKNNQKIGSAIQDLGCTVEFLREYLESQFQPGMTWENWGKNTGFWQIDHIQPLCSFDLTKREEFLKACHYTNLQPLWFEDHVKKGVK